MITRVNPTCQNGAECDSINILNIFLSYLISCVCVCWISTKKEKHKNLFEVQTWGGDLDRPIYGLSSRPGKQTNKRSHRLEEEEEEDGPLACLIYNIAGFPTFSTDKLSRRKRKKNNKKKKGLHIHKFRYVKSAHLISFYHERENVSQKSWHFFSFFRRPSTLKFKTTRQKEEKNIQSFLSIRSVSKKLLDFFFGLMESPHPSRRIIRPETFSRKILQIFRKGSKQVGVAKKRKRIQSVTLNC